MNNHRMFFYDTDGELELTRCCFCRFLSPHKAMNCVRGNCCSQDECDDYISIESENTSKRIDEIKKLYLLKSESV